MQVRRVGVTVAFRGLLLGGKLRRVQSNDPWATRVDSQRMV
jgi:hypothetical protein